MKLTNKKKKALSYILSLALCYVITMAPIWILEYIIPNNPNPQPTIEGWRHWMVIILGSYMFIIYVNNIINITLKPIYKFIKLKLFPM